MTGLPPAILLDLDDTILHAGERTDALLQSALEMAAEFGPHAPETVADAVEAALVAYWKDSERRKRGRFALREVRRQVAAEAFAGVGAPELTEVLAHRLAERFSDIRDACIVPFAGAIEAVAELKARGVRLALITNGDGVTQRGKIERHGLAGFFDHIQIEGEHGFGKPEPEAYHHCMAALGMSAADCWIVGDDLEWEVSAPQKLGIHAVWHDHRGAGLPADSDVKPDRIIRALTELLA